MLSITKLLSAAVAWSIAGVALSEIASRAPDAREWIDSLKQEDFEVLIAPTSLILIDSFGEGGAKSGTPVFKKYNHKLCRQVSYFDCAAARDAAFSALLNAKSAGAGVAGAFALSPANTVIAASGDKVLMYGRHSTSPVDLGMSKADFSKLNIKVLTDKILTALQYDAVVLAAKDDYLLVGSTESRLKRSNIQGLVVGSSSDKWSLAGVDSKGAGLLSMVSRYGGFGVFQVVLQGDSVGSTVPLGTKVLIETSKKRKSE